MFWASHDALETLSRIGTGLSYETESGRNDGQVAHAVERVMQLPSAMDARFVGLVSPKPQWVDGFSLELATALWTPLTHDFARLLRQRRVEHEMHGVELPPADRPIVAKKISTDNKEPGVNLIAPVTSLHGLGVSSRGYMKALSSAGINLNVIRW